MKIIFGVSLILFSGLGAALAASSPLAMYVGKYPSDKVNGITFLHQPTVATGVKKTVTDKKVRAWLLRDATVQTPIFMKEGKVYSQACEPHNCGDHQWTIIIDPMLGNTDVCYHDRAKMEDGQSRWYLSTGKSELREEQCPAE